MNKFAAAVSLLFLSWTSLSFLNGQSVKIDLEADRTAIRKADGEWLQAVNKKDIELVLSYYMDDAMWLLRGAPAQTGKDIIRKTWTRWFDAPGATIRWEPIKIEVSSSGDLGYSVGSFETKQPDKEGNITTQRGGYVAVWKKTLDGNWKIAIDISN